MKGVYIHIPFCKSKCKYCDFTSFDNKMSYLEQYKNALVAELENLLEPTPVSTVFVGGGTPTVMPAEYLTEILSRVPISPETEFTVEANPGTLTREMLSALKQAGVNRISMGLQAWQNHHLKRLGRIHDIETFLDNYKNTAESGFDNVNVDLMFGLPYQTMEEWQETLQNTVSLNPQPKHISVYGLTLEEGTNFYINKDKLQFPDEDTERQMYAYAREFLAKNGYEHYEISNFAKKGYESRHNCIYWECDEYLGFGTDAHSFHKGKRFRNTRDLEQYIRANGDPDGIRRDITEVSKREAMEEFMFLGLRMIKGIDVNNFSKRFGVDIYSIYGKQIKDLTEKGLLKAQDNRIFLSENAIDISNRVFAEFI